MRRRQLGPWRRVSDVTRPLKALVGGGARDTTRTPYLGEIFAQRTDTVSTGTDEAGTFGSTGSVPRKLAQEEKEIIPPR